METIIGILTIIFCIVCMIVGIIVTYLNGNS